LQFEVRLAAAQVRLGRQHVGARGVGFGFRRRRSHQAGQLIERLDGAPTPAGMGYTHEHLDANAGLDRGGFRRLGLQLELVGIDLDLFLIRFGDVARLEPDLGDLGLVAQVPGRLVEDQDIFLGQEGGDVSFGNALIQGPLGIIKASLGALDAGACRHLAVVAFAGDLD